MIEELTEKCKSQEGKMEQVKGFDAERRKYEVRFIDEKLMVVTHVPFRRKLIN